MIWNHSKPWTVLWAVYRVYRPVMLLIVYLTKLSQLDLGSDTVACSLDRPLLPVWRPASARFGLVSGSKATLNAAYGHAGAVERNLRLCGSLIAAWLSSNHAGMYRTADRGKPVSYYNRINDAVSAGT